MNAAPRTVVPHDNATGWGASIGLWEIDFERDDAHWFGDWCERLDLDACAGADHLVRWQAHIHPDDLHASARRLRDHLEGKEEFYDIEYRIRDRHGRWRWLIERGCVLARRADGTALRMLGVRVDIDARERQSLEREIIEIANREQTRIGSDLHDGLGQDLTGIALMLRGMAAQLHKERSAVRLDEVITLVNDAIESTRALARGLSPVSAERDGLTAALQALAARVGERYGLRVRLETQLAQPLRLDETAATHLYRIAQEALTNALRHSLATEVAIRLTLAGRELRLEVEDNGRGFPASAAESRNGLGLRIMRYRAQMLGGDLVMERGAQGGALITCSCPLT